MKKSSLFRWVSILLFVVAQFNLNAQNSPTALSKDPEWKVEVDKPNAKVGDEITLTFTSIIEKNWYMYSNDFDPNLGPIAAEFTFTKNTGYERIGDVKPIGAKKHYEEVWKGDVSVFNGKAVFKQRIKILQPNVTIKGSIYFQECNEISGVCMPPYDKEFEVKIKATADQAINTDVKVNTEQAKDYNQTQESIIDSATQNLHSDTAVIENEVTQAILPVREPKTNKDEGIFMFLLIAFATGLLAVITPCVFPMLPMTVSFFTKKSQSRAQGIKRAFIYGFSIISIYASLGLIFAFFGLGPDFGNWLSTHWLPNVLFFIIFMVFAASFFGMFEITLPHGLVNKIDGKGNIGSFGGIFFMAFTLVLVSFSCTGPIVGSLLIEAVGGKFIKPLMGMAAFGAGLALPFTIFAVFPSYLQNLPRSGGWLNSVKVVLGFIEVAFALKFLSIPDIVYHWGILDREIYLSIWIVLAILLGMYLLGKLKFSHDSDLPYIGVPRFMLAIASFSFAVYMIPGLFGAPLKGLSGLLPPMQTQDFILNTESGGHSQEANNTKAQSTIKYSDFLHSPHGINAFFDYKQALEESKKQNKPVFVDFTGHACVNCRKMEEYVWAKPEVLKRLKNDFIVVSLYVDERRELPESDWFTSPRDGKVKKTIGEQNHDLQITKYNFSAQPQYIIIDANENKLTESTFFDTDEQRFVQFLESGKQAYQKK
ncbi:MAG: thioredoxin family protein [Bacteroidia bacterium]|nr:thioredoxin family protein [Bacteroidia bacterium]